MNNQKKLIGFLLWCFSRLSLADIYSDVAAIASNSAELSSIQSQYMPYMQTLDQTSKTISNLTGEHFDWVENTQWKALTSSYSMSRALHNAVPAELWTAAEWEEALEATSGGNSSRYNELKASYAAKNPVITSSTTSVDVGQLTDNTYTQKSAIANTALAASQYTYEDVDNRAQSFDELKTLLDDNSENGNPNEKSAIDLNTRVLLEIGYIQNEMLRLQTIQAQVDAMKAQEEINANTTDKNFFKNHE